MDKADFVYILIDDDREPSKAFATMQAAKDHCQADVNHNLQYYSAAPSGPIKWDDYERWSHGLFMIPDTKGDAFEYSILIMPLLGGDHPQETTG